MATLGTSVGADGGPSLAGGQQVASLSQALDYSPFSVLFGVACERLAHTRYLLHECGTVFVWAPLVRMPCVGGLAA